MSPIAKTPAVSHLEPIPRPPGHPLIGNLFDVDMRNPVASLMDLARKYGPIYRLSVRNRSRVVVSGHELVAELCDDTRFDKTLGPITKALAMSPVGRGLFTTETADPDWQVAHNVLLPAFSMDAMRSYFEQMLDVAVQLMQKWERLNPADEVDVTAEITRVTLDTIALCGFNYRFNSLYRDTPHPFVVAMNAGLGMARVRSSGLPDISKFKPGRSRQFAEYRELVLRTVQEIIDERRQSGTVGTVGDLLDRMLMGVDRRSGAKLDDGNIIAQCLTFLFGGHETTSGLLSFAIYALMKHPDLLARAYAEVDRVLGTDPGVLPTYAQTHQLQYISQVLDETLRLWPVAPMFARRAYEDTVIGGKYQVEHAVPAVVLIGMLHRDKQVWGADPEAFNPDHFSPENRAKIPVHAYKPFGTGQRACIGRQFALQEASLLLGMLLQRFEFVDFANYQLKVTTSLTNKPDNFRIRLKRRRHTATAPILAQHAAPQTAPPPAVALPAVQPGSHQTPLLVLYGSNLGSAEALAHSIADEAKTRGFVATTGALDDYVGSLPQDGGVIIVTASYNGQPPDNAGKFCGWLRDPAVPADAFAGVAYSVFGCGNRDWAATYQAIPALIDSELEKHGARRMYARGEGDARGDADGDYRSWHAGLWPAVAKALQLPSDIADAQTTGPRFAVSFINRQPANTIIRSYSAVAMEVLANRELQQRECERPSDRSTRHLEVALPPGVTYSAGDHLGIVPRNNIELIRRVWRRLKLDPAVFMTITPRGSVSTHLPVNEPVPLIGLLANRVELQDVATRVQLATLAEYTHDAGERQTLVALAGDDAASQARYREMVFEPRKSVLDLIEDFPSCAPPFEVFLDLLPPLRPRYYSTSSSPLVAPDRCSITVGVVEQPRHGREGVFHGTCSNYLAQQPVGSTVYGFIHKPSLPFHPPANPHLPMIMVGPGTGIAPFRGFLQERGGLKQRGVPVGPSMLFCGCRDPLQDFLYQDELRAFEAAGVTRLLPAFSREPGKPKTYVQQVIRQHSADVWRLLQQEALVYVCGEASRMAPDVRQAIVDVFCEHTGASDADGQIWLTGLTASQRYLEDIWASTT